MLIIYISKYLSLLKPIREIAFRFLTTIPATAAPIERIWSKAGQATYGHRSKTGPALLDDQLRIFAYPV